VVDNNAGNRAQQVLEQVLNENWEFQISSFTAQSSNDSVFSAAVSEDAEEELDQEGEDQENSGNSVIGILEIPGLKLTLPVLSSCTNTMLSVSIGRYTGRVSDRPERLIIAGHNYKSHFGNLLSLKPGDEIRFTTRDGETLRYSMLGVDSCHMSETEAAQAGEDWDITLLTCKRDRTMRTLVRFQEIPNR